MTLSSDATRMREAGAMLRAASRIAIVTHVTPDPDAIGSMLGLGHALRELGKEPYCLCDDLVPPGLFFLPGSFEIRTALPPCVTPDLAVGVDASDAERLGRAWLLASGAATRTLNIDHHITNPAFATLNVINSEWASTAEGILDVIDACRIPLTHEVATCLLAGVVGDTRSFSTASTTPASLRAAARLMAADADIANVTEQIFGRRSVETLRFWGMGLSNLRIEDGVIWCTITMDERRALGVTDTTGSGLSNVLISADEANIAAVFTEQPDTTIDLSLRARGGFDVAGAALVR